MRYYIIAGEASGDKHGAKLVESIKRQDAESDFRAWGGDEMSQAGANVVKHYKDLAFMGFVEVLKNIKTILRNFKYCKADILAFQPDVVILIDYPGFNLRMAKWLFEQKIKVAYYISPQIWAWNEKRVHAIKKHVDQMFVILPFEKSFYEKYQMDVFYVGHPLKGVIDRYKNECKVDIEPTTIALLPGSRKQEISIMTPIFFEVARNHPALHFVVAMAPHVEESTYQKFIPQGVINIELSSEGSYALLNRAGAALCTSGTATLETALFRVPQVVCYKGSTMNYQIAKRLIKVKFISLVNLIADQEVVIELIQENCNPKNISKELDQIIIDHENHSTRRKDILDGYSEVHKLLVQEEDPSELVAKGVISLAKNA